MSTKSNPGPFNCYAAAFPDETIFTMLARDPAMPSTIQFWCEQRRQLGKAETEDDLARIAAAYEESIAAIKWRAANLDPFGDGTPTWRVPLGIDDTTTRPISTLIDKHEGDGDEAVRINRNWLYTLIERLESAPDMNDVRRVAEELSLARDSGLPAEFNGFNQPVEDYPERETGKLAALGAAYGGDPYEAAGDPYKGFAETLGEKVVVDSEPSDLAHAPEVPPHRFSTFVKGERYAYARGLEINPSHLPVALDAMALDGWDLLAIFGQTDSQHVGFIFQRRLEFVVVGGNPRLDAEIALQNYRDRFPAFAREWAKDIPLLPRDGLDVEVEVHVTARTEEHADKAVGWLKGRLHSPTWPVEMGVRGLVDGRPKLAFDIRCQPGQGCSEFGRQQEP